MDSGFCCIPSKVRNFFLEIHSMWALACFIMKRLQDSDVGFKIRGGVRSPQFLMGLHRHPGGRGTAAGGTHCPPAPLGLPLLSPGPGFLIEQLGPEKHLSASFDFSAGQHGAQVASVTQPQRAAPPLQEKSGVQGASGWARGVLFPPRRPPRFHSHGMLSSLSHCCLL